jgi:hypothetical protein
VVHGLGVVIQLALLVGPSARPQRLLLLAWPFVAILLYLVVVAWQDTAYFFELAMPNVGDWILIAGTVLASLSVSTILERALITTTSARTTPGG